MTPSVQSSSSFDDLIISSLNHSPYLPTQNDEIVPVSPESFSPDKIVLQNDIKTRNVTIFSQGNAPRDLGFIGPYELIKVIGEGGMGSVYLAQQSEPVKRSVALKLIRADIAASSMYQRFQLEMQTLALMDHPQIAKVLDAGTSRMGEPYMVMELIPDGLPLTTFADRQQLTIHQRLELFISVCQGVQHAHQKGIIHRDLKPSNILVGQYDGKPIAKIIDFGIAKTTRDNLLHGLNKQTTVGGVIGTLEYMSPEQAQGDADIDTRSDVYALGIILCELLTGTTPNQSKLQGLEFLPSLQIIARSDISNLITLLDKSSWQSVAEFRQSDQKKLRSYLTGELNWIVQKALSRERELRYTSAIELATDLQRYLGGEAVSAHPPSRMYHFRKLVSKHRWPFGLALTVMVLLFSFSMLMFWQQQKTLEQKKIADDFAYEWQNTALKLDKTAARLEIVATQEKKERQNAEEQKKKAQQNLQQMIRGFDILSSLLANAGNENVQNEISGEELKKQISGRLEQVITKLDGEENFGNPEMIANLKNTLASTLLLVGKHHLALEMLQKMNKNLENKLSKDNEQAIRSLLYLGWAYRADGQNQKAIKTSEDCLQLCQKKLGVNHDQTLTAMNNLAVAYQTDLQVKRAIPLYEYCLTIRKEKNREEFPNFLITVSNLARAYEMDDQNKKAIALYEQYYPQALQQVQKRLPAAIILMNNMGISYIKDGQTKRAISILEECFALFKEILGQDHPDTLISMDHLASGYQAIDRLDLTIPLLEKCLKLSQMKLGKDHPSTLATLNNLALALGQDGQMQMAISLFEECLFLRQQKLENDHINTLNTCYNLAIAYQKANHLKKSTELLEKCLPPMKKKLGKDDSQVSLALSNLAANYQMLNQSDRAIPLLEECLLLRQQKYGKTSPDTLLIMNELGKAYRHTNQLQKAIPLFEDCLALRQQSLGKDNPLTLDSMNQLGIAYLKINNLSKAISILETCWTLQKQKLGKFHPDTEKTLTNLAYAYQSSGQNKQLLPILEAFWEVKIHNHGEDHLDTLNVQNNLALIYRDSGQLSRAIPLLEKCLELKNDSLGQKHPDTLATLNNLVIAYLMAGTQQRAAALLEDCLASLQSEPDRDELQIASEQAFLGYTYMKMKKYAKAENQFRICLQLRQSKLKESWLLDNTKSLLGGSLLAQKNLKEAEPLLIQGYQGLLAKQDLLVPLDRIRIQEARDRLIELYEAKGEKEKADQLRK